MAVCVCLCVCVLVSFEALQVALKHKKTVVQKPSDTMAVARMCNLQCTERGSVIWGMLCSYHYVVFFNGRFKLKFYINYAHFHKVLYWSWLPTDLFFFTSSPLIPPDLPSLLLSSLISLLHIFLLSSPPVFIFFYHFLSFLFSPCWPRCLLSPCQSCFKSVTLITSFSALLSLSPFSLSLSACHSSSASPSLGICFSFSLLVYLGVGPLWPFLFYWHHHKKPGSCWWGHHCTLFFMCVKF